MLSFRIERTSKTPLVVLNKEKTSVQIRGRSSPESSINFYFPLIEKIDAAFTGSERAYSLHVALEYFNTSSSKCLLDLMKIYRRLQRQGTTVLVHWYYEEDDEDMREAGEDYAEVLGLPFRFVCLTEEAFYEMVYETESAAV